MKSTEKYKNTIAAQIIAICNTAQQCEYICDNHRCAIGCIDWDSSHSAGIAYFEDHSSIFIVPELNHFVEMTECSVCGFHNSTDEICKH